MNEALQAFVDKYLLDPFFYIGLVGQVAFFSRFLVQWLISEKKGESTIPVAFWYLSITGGLMLLVYAIRYREPILLLGQSVGVFVYSRNLVLIARTKRLHGDATEDA